MIFKKAFSRQSPNLDLSDFKQVLSTVTSNTIYSGPKIEEFEKQLSDYLNQKYVILVNMGRTAELLALQSLDFSVDDQIIMPSYNFPIVPIIVKMLGLKPVFVDVEEDTFNIDPELIEKNINSKTRAIFITHMCGHPCKMDPILKIAKKYNLKLIEDGVHSLGAEYKSKKVGCFGDISYFSFYVGKSMTTFMGAVAATNDFSLYSKMKAIIQNYKKISLKSLTKEIGYGSLAYFLTKPSIFSFTVYPLFRFLNVFNPQFIDEKMEEPLDIPSWLPAPYLTKFTNLQAAVGLSQLNKFEDSLSQRIFNSMKLSQYIQNNKSIVAPVVKPDCKHAFLYYFLRAKNRQNFRKDLLINGVDTKRDSNRACSHLNIFKEEYKYCPISERISLENTLIPNYPNLSSNDIRDIAEAINSVISKK